jgi:hypothetical protein
MELKELPPTGFSTPTVRYADAVKPVKRDIVVVDSRIST